MKVSISCFLLVFLYFFTKSLSFHSPLPRVQKFTSKSLTKYDSIDKQYNINFNRLTLPLKSSSNDKSLIKDLKLEKTDIHAPENKQSFLSMLVTPLMVISLTLQNTLIALTMRLSRVRKNTSGKTYIASTAVVSSEFIKIFFCILFYYFELKSEYQNQEIQKGTSDSNSSTKFSLGQYFPSLFNISTQTPALLQVSIPSILYTFQNNLQYTAMSCLPAVLYQILVQLKLLTTAVLSYTYLKRNISFGQWFSIISLTFGVILVQLSALKPSSLNLKSPHINFSKGLIAVGLSCLTSAFAGVYFEKLLKDEKSVEQTCNNSNSNIVKHNLLWEKNYQISFISFFLSVILMFAYDKKALFTQIGDNSKFKSFFINYFEGYTPLVWSVILLHSIGGLLTSLIVKRTNSIVKSFTSTASILLTTILSLYFKDIHLNFQLVLGGIFVCVSSLAYSYFAPVSPK